MPDPNDRRPPARRTPAGLYRRTNSPFWWASYFDARGRRIRRSTGTTDATEAAAIAATWRFEARRAIAPGEPPPSAPTFDELLLAYLDGPSAEKRAAERDRYSAKRLYDAFSGRVLTELRPADIRGYTDARRAAGASNGTINREIGLLSAALNWARRELEWDVPNPAAGRRLREPEGRVRWLKREEAARLIAAAAGEPQAEHLADFIRLALNTGCRRDELLRLEWARVDLSARLLRLDAIHTKGGRRRSVPLNAEARVALANRLAFLRAHCPDSPWVFCDETGARIASIKRSFATACRRAGIEDFHIHDLRHTCAAWLVSAGVPLPEVRDLLGHSTVAMTERYAHLAPERVRAAVEMLDGPGAGSAPGRLRAVNK